MTEEMKEKLGLIYLPGSDQGRNIRIRLCVCVLCARVYNNEFSVGLPPENELVMNS